MSCCRIWKESWLSAFFHKPCNHELFVLQSLNMEGGCCRHCLGCPPVLRPSSFDVAKPCSAHPWTHQAEPLAQVSSACCRQFAAQAEHVGTHLQHRLCAAVGIEMAQHDGIDWLLHVDTDELIYPSGSPAFSLQVHTRELGY